MAFQPIIFNPLERQGFPPAAVKGRISCRTAEPPPIIELLPINKLMHSHQTTNDSILFNQMCPARPAKLDIITRSSSTQL